MSGSSKTICSSLLLLIPLQTTLGESIKGLETPAGLTASAWRNPQSQNGSTIPRPSTHVSDLAGAIQATTRARLENALTNLERQAAIELKLVTVETTSGEDIFGFSHRLARDWNIGHRTSPRKSLLMVIAVKERSVFVQFSRAAQLDLPEGIIGEARQRIRESLNSPQFNEGLINGVEYLVSSLARRVGLSASAIEPQPQKFVESSPLTSPKGSAQMETNETILEISPARRADLDAAEVSRAKEDPPEQFPNKNPVDPRNEVYRVGIRDVLTIATANSAADPSRLYTVNEDGSINFAGVPVVVAGLTTAEVLERLKKESKTQGLEMRNLLAVSVRQYASHAITVTGLLRIQGTLYLKRETVPLYAIIAEVQPQFGAGEVIVMRGGKAGPILDLYDSEALRYVIEPGDVINVTARRQQFYYIDGHIKQPGQKGFEPGVTLLQAILAAGGLMRQSDQIQLLREGPDGLLSTSKFDLREIKTGRIEDVRLQPGDRLEIGP